MATALPTRSELELRDYVQVLRRRKVILALVLIAVLAGGLVYTLVQTKVYEGRGAVVVEVGAASAVISPGGGPNVAVTDEQVKTEAELMRSSPVQADIAELAGYEPDVEISTVDETPAVIVTSRNTSPERAAKEVNDFVVHYVTVRRDGIALSLANSTTDVRAQIENLDVETARQKIRMRQLEGELRQIPDETSEEYLVKATQLERLRVQVDPERVVARQALLQENLDEIATRAAINSRGDNYTVSQSKVPATPVEPRPVRNGVIALSVGLLLGIIAAFLRDYFDDTMRTKEEVDGATGGLPVLSLVPAVPTWRDRSTTVLESIAHPHSATSESYRSLRTALEFAAIEHKIGIIHITSSTSGEGKTTTAANLAVTLASTGKRVVLVDCDLRRPRVHKFFGMENAVGFTSVLVGEIDAQDALQPVDNVPGLLVLPSGPRPPNPAELLSTKATHSLLDTLAKFADHVVVDSPPLLPVADSSVLAGYAHATILVVAAKATSRRSLHRSLELLSQVNAPLEGIVFNGVGSEATYGKGYGYTYGDEDDGEDEGEGGFRRIRARAAARGPYAGAERPRSNGNGSSSGTGPAPVADADADVTSRTGATDPD